MSFRLPTFVAALVFSVFSQAPYGAEKVSFRSYDPSRYDEILTGKFKESPVELFGYLSIPAASAGKVPAVVIIPGSGGYQPWMQTNVADFLNANGIATFIIDPYTGRGVTETASDQGRVSFPASLVDALAAYKLLSEHPAIDGQKIAITGFSRGGTMAIGAADERVRRAVLGSDPGYAAYAPMYPGCVTQWRHPSVKEVKMLMMLGEKDDWTDPKPCIDYADRFSKAGASVEVKIYPGAHHAWNSTVGTRRWLPKVQNFSDCVTLIEDNGTLVNTKSGKNGGTMPWSEWVKDLFSVCGRWGANVASDAATVKSSNNDLLLFLNKSFGR